MNRRIMRAFADGQRRLLSGNCRRADSHLAEIWDLMSVPLIQGTLRYARLMDEPSGVGRASERKGERQACVLCTARSRFGSDEISPRMQSLRKTLADQAFLTVSYAAAS